MQEEKTVVITMTAKVHWHLDDFTDTDWEEGWPSDEELIAMSVAHIDESRHDDLGDCIIHKKEVLDGCV